MPFNGSDGTFSRLYSWAADAASNIRIMSARMDAEDNGFAAGLSNCITRDGQSTPVADLPMGNRRLINLGAAQVGSDALNRDTADARYAQPGGDVSFNTVSVTANNTGQNIAVGDDVWLGDNNITSGMMLSGRNDANSGFIRFGLTGLLLGVSNGGPLTYGGGQIYTSSNINSGVITGALGYTPYNNSNPSGYISGINSGMVTGALGYTPYNSSNPSGYISGITSGNVTGALGYTPANRAGDTFTGPVGVQGDLTVTGGALASYFKVDVQAYFSISGGSVIINLDNNKYLKFDRSSGKLYFASGGTNVFSIDGSGNLRVAGNVYGNTTP